MEKEFYICSELVVKLLNPQEVSKPILVYPHNEHLKEKVFVAVLDFKEVEKIYNSFHEDSNEQFEFWCEEIVPGQMNVDSIKMKHFKENDPWTLIEEKLTLTKLNNRAMTICNICDREGLNPIEFWNKISELRKQCE